MTLKQIITVSLLFCLTLAAKAQKQETPQIKLLHYNFGDSVALRWAPTDRQLWQAGVSYGYVVERFTLLRDGQFVEGGFAKGIKLTETPVKPYPEHLFEELIKTEPQAALVYEAVYPDQFREVTPEEGISAFIQSQREADMRFGFALFSCDMSPRIALSAGLYFVDRTVKPNEQYAYRIYLAATPDHVQGDTAAVMVRMNQPSMLPPVEDVRLFFGDKTAKIQWNLGLYEGIYSAYIIERSSDNKKFTPVSDKPIVPTFNENQNDNEGVYIDSLPANNQLYYYRLLGLSPFGLKGPAGGVLSGKGKPVFDAYAVIDTAIVTNNKKITIKWKVQADSANPVKGFLVERAVHTDSLYLPLNKKLISAKTRNFIDEAPLRTNYYRIRVQGSSADEFSYSFPYFAHLEDNDPPKAPLGLAGTVDSAGIVRLNWQANTEPDLDGYRVFRANTVSGPFLERTTRSITQTSFTDTITLHTLTQTICYQLVATDRMYNNSAFSAPVQLTRPDTIAPAPAVIRGLTLDNNGLVLNWEKSPSTDVTEYRLYYQLTDTGSWNSITSWTAAKCPERYLHKEAPAGSRVRYRLQTIDRSGNTSYTQSIWQQTPGAILNCQLELKATVNRETRGIELAWKKNNCPVDKYLVYRKVNNEPMSLLTTLPANETRWTDTAVSLGLSYQYLVKAVAVKGNTITEKTKPIIY